MTFVRFSNKRRFEQIYKTSLWNETVSEITDVFYKTGVLRNFTKFIWKHLCWSLFFNKVAGLRPETLLKRDSNTGVFRWILWNFLRTTFLQNPCGGCFFIKDLFLSIFCNEKMFQTNLFQPFSLTSSNMSFYMTKQGVFIKKLFVHLIIF